MGRLRIKECVKKDLKPPEFEPVPFSALSCQIKQPAMNTGTNPFMAGCLT
jgi:hypothetical protein